MKNKQYKITIDEGTAPDSNVIVDVNSSEFAEKRTQDVVITEAISQNIIQTHDVKWISKISEVK